MGCEVGMEEEALGKELDMLGPVFTEELDSMKWGWAVK